MISSASGKLTLVVEGIADLRLFQQWLVPENARLTYVDGKDNVLHVWDAAAKQSAAYVHCLADIDFDLIVGERPIESDTFTYVSMSAAEGTRRLEGNDLDATLIRSKALEKLLVQKVDVSTLQEGLERYVGALREQLRVAASVIGAYRAADLQLVRRHRLSAIGGDLSIEDTFFDADRISLDQAGLEQTLIRSSRAGQSMVDKLIANGRELRKKYSSGWALCRGHDLTDMLALHLTRTGRRRVGRLEVEEGLRLACEITIVRQTLFGARLHQHGINTGKPLLSFGAQSS